MSVIIDDSRPFTESEKEHLRTLGTAGLAKIKVNERQFQDVPTEDVEALQKQASEGAAEEQAQADALAKAQAEEDEDSYHSDDLDQVVDLTTAQLRERLAKENLSVKVTDEDKDPSEGVHLTEKQVLAYRLLDHLDGLRKAE